MERTLHLNLKLTGTCTAGAEKEIPFERVVGLSLKVTGDETPDDLSEALLEAVKSELGNVVQDAVDAAARGYKR